mgnify:CR=1 FL=1
MTILSNAFYLVMFLSAVGGLFSAAWLLVGHVFRRTLPLCFSLCGLALYLVPLLSPGVSLFSPEKPVWQSGFLTASAVWGVGCAAFAARLVLRSLLARRAGRKLVPCGEAGIKRICAQCAESLGLKAAPLVCWGSFRQPACVAGVLHPFLLLDRSAAVQLTEKELTAVFTHELTHIKRRHLLWERLWDVVCVLHWFNPLVWLARKEFSLHCEADCDRRSLAALKGTLSRREYTLAILRLLELASLQAISSGREIGALRFLLAKRRLREITVRRARVWNWAASAALGLLLALVLAASLSLSRQHFYPYPAYSAGTEQSDSRPCSGAAQIVEEATKKQF